MSGSHDRMLVLLSFGDAEERLSPIAKPKELLRLRIPSPDDWIEKEDAGLIRPPKPVVQESLF